MSLCWASSSISGREVMISRCTPKGATLTTSSSWEQRSWNGNRESSTLQYQRYFSTQHYTWHTFPLTMWSSHLSWFRISCGISWYSLSPRPLKWEWDRDWYTAWHNVWVCDCSQAPGRWSTHSTLPVSSMYSVSFCSSTLATEGCMYSTPSSSRIKLSSPAERILHTIKCLQL